MIRASEHIRQALEQDPNFDLERGVFIGWYHEHTADQIDYCLETIGKLGRELGVI